MTKTGQQPETHSSVKADCSPAFFDRDGVTIYNGDCRTVLASLPSGSVNCCVTSPPYFGLRDYHHDGQIGLETTPTEYVDEMVAVFREVRRVLRDDGTLWLNLGDSYANDGKWGGQTGGKHARALHGGATANGRNKKYTGYKPKDLMGMPWQVAFALRADGWYLRQDIIWAKPNPMPESVGDRCTKSHEYLFLFAKSERYHCDMKSIAEPVTDSTIERLSQPNLEGQNGSDRVPGKTNGNMKAVGGIRSKRLAAQAVERTGGVITGGTDRSSLGVAATQTRNRRSVWTVTTQPFTGAHFATFPPALIEPCILAGCPAGGTVLDPFLGSGTTAEVARRQGCRCVGIELNTEYAALAAKRFRQRSLLSAS